MPGQMAREKCSSIARRAVKNRVGTENQWVVTGNAPHFYSLSRGLCYWPLIKTQILQIEMKKSRMPRPVENILNLKKKIFLKLYTHMYLGWPTICFPRTVPALALKVLHPEKSLSPRQTRTTCHPTCIPKVFKHSVHQNHPGYLIKT